MSRGSRGRWSAWEIAFLAACGLALACLAFLGRSTTFWFDDWVILTSPGREGWTLDALMSPHNDHWQLTQMMVWKALQATIGLRSHLPYLLATLVMHVVAALAVYGLVRRQAGPFVAFAAGLLFLLLGTGGEVFFFAAAFNLVAATALGCWALLVFLPDDPLVPIGRRRQTLAAALLLAATASGGPGLFYLPAVAVVALLVTGRRREIWVAVPAGIAFLVWQLIYGSGSSSLSSLQDPSVLRTLGDYVRTGIAHAAGAVMGMEDQVGLVIGVALLGATAWHLLGRQPLRVGAAAAAAGLLSTYLVTGLARAELGLEQATAARYAYTAAPFVLLLLAAWLASLAPVDVRRPRVAMTVAVFMAVALTANLVQLGSWQRFFLDRAAETRAAVTLLLRHGGSPALPSGMAPVATADLQIDGIPSPDRLREIIQRMGSPLDDPASESARVSAAEEEGTLLRLIDPAFRVAQVPTISGGRGPLHVGELVDASVTMEGACARVSPSGPAPSVTLRIANGGEVLVRSDVAATLGMLLSRTGSWDLAVPRQSDLPAGAVLAISVPDLADGEDWRLRLSLPVDGSSLICPAAPPSMTDPAADPGPSRELTSRTPRSPEAHGTGDILLRGEATREES